MANSLLHSQPHELTFKEFQQKMGWSFAQCARELEQDERTLYLRAKIDSKDSAYFLQWRRYLALVYKASKVQV